MVVPRDAQVKGESWPISRALHLLNRVSPPKDPEKQPPLIKDDTLRNRIEPMEEEGAVGESEEEEEGAVVDVGVSDSEEELEVLQQPNLIQKLADVVRLRASCVIELEGGAQLTIRPATQRRRPPTYTPATHKQKAPACSTRVLSRTTRSTFH